MVFIFVSCKQKMGQHPGTSSVAMSRHCCIFTVVNPLILWLIMVSPPKSPTFPRLHMPPLRVWCVVRCCCPCTLVPGMLEDPSCSVLAGAVDSNLDVLTDTQSCYPGCAIIVYIPVGRCGAFPCLVAWFSQPAAA